MADYLVLEEDGTSHLELEESSDDFLLEESGPFERRGAGIVGAAGAGATPTPPPSYATWKAGVLTAPGSPGSVAVTGLGGTPCAVFFLGVNFSTQDSPVSTTGTGIGRGMAAPQYNSPGTILNHSAFVSPAGDQSRLTGGWAFSSLTTAGNATAVDLDAAVTSFDSDGFTVAYTNVTSGRILVWVALLDVRNCGGYVGTSTTLSLGWKAGASLLHGSWLGPTYTSPDEAGEYWGGGAYPGTNPPDWYGAGLSAVGHPAHANQWAIGIYNNVPSTAIAQGATFIGPSLTTGNVVAYPTGTGLANFNMDFTSANGGMVVAWDDEDSQTGRLTPAQNTGDTATVSGLPFAPGLVIGYSISDEPPGQSSGSPVRGAVQLSVQTADFQWAGIVDDNTQSAYQSLNRGFVDTISGSNLHAGTIELTADGFVLTTEEDTATAHEWVWHAFGHPDQFPIWIPQEYRRH